MILLCNCYSYYYKVGLPQVFLEHAIPASYLVFTDLYYNSPLSLSVCLSQLANCRLQFLLDRLGRCLKLFVSTDSTSCHEFASQFSLAIFLYMKDIQNYREYLLAHVTVYLNEAPTGHSWPAEQAKRGHIFAMVGCTPTHGTATTWMVTAAGG